MTLTRVRYSGPIERGSNMEDYSQEPDFDHEVFLAGIVILTDDDEEVYQYQEDVPCE